MNNYYLAFKYKNDVNIIKVSANELANELLGGTDDILDFKYDGEYKESQAFSKKMYICGNEYVVDLDSDNIGHVILSDAEGNIVEKNIPWICLRIEDSFGQIIYDISNEF